LFSLKYGFILQTEPCLKKAPDSLLVNFSYVQYDTIVLIKEYAIALFTNIMYSNLSKGIVNKDTTSQAGCCLYSEQHYTLFKEVFGIFTDFKYNKYVAFRETTKNI